MKVSVLFRSFILASFSIQLSHAAPTAVGVIDIITKSGVSNAEVFHRGQLLKTDSTGTILLDLGSEPLFSIYHPQYHLYTYARVPAHSEVKVELVPYVSSKVEATISGKSIGFGTLKPDGTIDGALVTAAPSLGDLLAMNQDKFLAKDVPISVGPVKTKIPGNIDLPKQSESYIGIPVTINKPGFELQVSASQPSALFSIHAKIPFSEAIDVAQSKKGVASLLNNTRFQSLSIVEPKPYRNGDVQDLRLDVPLQPTLSHTLKTLAKGWDTIAGTVINWDGAGHTFIPMDLRVKLAQWQRPITAKLNTPSRPIFLQQDLLFVHGLTHFPDDMNASPTELHVTAAIQTASGKLESESYLPIASRRTLNAQGISWELKPITTSPLTADTHIHSLSLNHENRNWVIELAPGALRFQFPEWPAHWPQKRSLTSKGWVQTLLITRQEQSSFRYSHVSAATSLK